MVTDPIGDLIVRIKNAQMVGHPSISLPYSQLKHAIAEKLVERGFLKSVSKKGKKAKKTLEIELAYLPSGKPKVTYTERVSKPGRRLYAGSTEIHKVKQGNGALIVSTPKGILSDEEARKEKVGGELLFKIW